MSRFEIAEAKLYHCGKMARIMREEQRLRAIRLGFNVHRELQTRFQESSWRKVWLIDGELGALGGVTGPALSAGGCVWLVFSQRAMKYPIEMCKESQRQLAEIAKTKRTVWTSVPGGDRASMRFAYFLGFRAISDMDYGTGVATLFEYREAA